MEFGLKIRGLTAMSAAANILIALTKMIAVQMCSVSNKEYGFYYQNNQWHSCVVDVQYGDIFRWLAIASLALTGYGLMIDFGKANFHLDVLRSINITKTLFTISLIVITYELDTVASIAMPEQIAGPNALGFYSFWWAMPIAMSTFVWTTWMIVTRREMVINLKPKK
jgi:hypothetical protein